MSSVRTLVPRRRRVPSALAALGASAAFAIAGLGVAGTGTAVAAPAAASVTTVCPQTTPNAKFVRWVYMQILYRCPDDAGLTYWTTALNDGLSRYAFVNSVDLSSENLLGNNIEPLYNEILGRSATSTEVSTWLPKFRSEQGDADLIATLASSDEFWNDLALWHTDDTYCAPATTGATEPADKVGCWLYQLYENVLDRAPDAEGFAFFESVLGPNPTAAQRYAVAFTDFEHSQENARDWVLAAYGAAFNRAPDSPGAQFWYQWLLNKGFMTFNMWQQMIASSESYTLSQAQPNPPAAKAAARH